MTEPVYKYKEGDEVIVGPTVRWEVDKRYLGKKGIILNDRWSNEADNWEDGKGNVYRVKIGEFIRPMFESDLTPYTKNQSLLAYHRAEIERLEEEIAAEEVENIPTNLKVGSSIFFLPDTLLTKVNNNKWHWFHVGGRVPEHHSNSDDKAVVSAIKYELQADKDYEVFPADKD